MKTKLFFVSNRVRVIILKKKVSTMESKVNSHQKNIKPHVTPSRTLYSRFWGYLAAVVLLPYAILKSIWLWGGTIGLTTDQAIINLSGMADNLKEQSSPFYYLYIIGIDFTSVLAIIASIFALSFVSSWGKIVPSWVPLLKNKKVPRWILIVPGWIVGLLTIAVFFLTIIQLLGYLPKGNSEGLAFWVYGITYGGLFIWGLSIFMATVTYQHQLKIKNDPSFIDHSEK